MTTCENDHERIVHDEFHCPLCAEREDFGESRVSSLEQRIAELENDLETLQESAAAVTLAQRDEAETRAIVAERKLSSLAWEVSIVIDRPATKTAILDRLRTAHLHMVQS